MTTDSPHATRAPAWSAASRAIAAGLAAIALAAPASAAAAAPVEGYGAADGGGFRDVLATGSGGRQLPMFRDLMYATPGLTRKALPGFFGDATFGVRDDDVASTFSPRPDVTIVRDATSGIPHVYGATRDGAMFGLGWVAAADRLFAMDVLRHAGRAQLSSFLGGAAQAADAAQWRFAPYSEADLARQAEQLPHLLGFRGEVLLSDVDQYVAGINAYLATLTPARLPPQYAAIGRRTVPARWTRADVVAGMAAVDRALAPGDGGELARSSLRQALVARFGRRAGLRVLGETLGSRPRSARRGSRALPDPGSLQPATFAQPTPPAAATVGRAEGGGAGALLVSRGKSHAGRPLMVAGPQLYGPAAGALMQEDVHAPASAGQAGLDARGAAIAGAGPYVAFGHGRDYAWSAASGGGLDTVDTFAVPLCEPGGGPATTAATHYLYRGDCLPMVELARTNRWAPRASDHTPAGTQVLRAERTALGIVVARGTVRGRPVAFTSLRATYLHELDSAVAFQALDEPASVRGPRTFLRAAGRVGIPSQWFYVDDRHIATFTAGASPLRARGTDPTLPIAAGHDWRGWDALTWTARSLRRSAHPRGVDRRTIATSAFAAALRHATRRRHRIRLAHLVGLMETQGTADRRARAVLGEALAVLGRPRAAAVRGAARELRAWLRAGALRRDRDGDGAYEHADAIRIMDAWWPLLVRQELAPSLGPTAFAALRSAVGGSWTGVVRRDLHAVLAHRRALCGRRAACRHVLRRSLATAAATPAAVVYPATAGCAAGAQPCHDAIAVGGARIPWIDRPIYQQVVDVHREVTPPSGSCGGVHHAYPAARPAGGGPPPLLIGDSVVLGAIPQTTAIGFEVDARGCRGFEEGVEVLRLRAQTTRLPHLVVMQLGTDGSVPRRAIVQAIRVVGRHRVLGLVTPREVFGHSTSDARAMRTAARRHRHRVVLLDWARYSRDHASWFQPDDVHLTVAGARAFAAFLSDTLGRAGLLGRQAGR